MQIILRKGEPARVGVSACRRVGGRAKTSALLLAGPSILHPHAPGLSHSLPIDSCSNLNN
jgi:hypothetical protein